MALHGNRSVLHKSPGRFLSGTIASGDRSAFNKPGMMRNRFQATSAKSGIPNGYLPPVSWVMPNTAGGMVSYRQANISYSASANGLMGMPGTGTASYSITTNAPMGGLIVSGSGTASYSITTNSPLLKAVINGSGTSSYSITTNSPTLGAIASLSASAFYSFSVAGVLRGIGHMTGTTLVTETLTAASVAEAVWAKELEGTYTAAQVQRIIAAALAGKVSGAETNAPVFRSIDDTSNVISASTDADGNRIAVSLSPG